jgi:hypothetical protein
MQDDRETTRSSIWQVVAIIVAIVAILVGVLNPEIRQWLGLGQSTNLEPSPTATVKKPVPTRTTTAALTPTLTPTARPLYSATFISNNVPPDMLAGQTYRVRLLVRNTGRLHWTTEGGPNPVTIGYDWFTPQGQRQLDFEEKRTPLSSDVSTDQEIGLDIQIATPRTPGTYLLRLDLVHEGVTWFSQQDSQPLIVQVMVSP